MSAQKKQYSQKVFVHIWTNPREYTGKVYNHQTAKDAALSEKAQSGNQSSNQSGNQTIGELTTPTYSQTSKVKQQTTAAKKPSPRDEIRKFAQTVYAETQGGRFDDRPESATEWDARVFGNRSQ